MAVENIECDRPMNHRFAWRLQHRPRRKWTPALFLSPARQVRRSVYLCIIFSRIKLPLARKSVLSPHQWRLGQVHQGHWMMPWCCRPDGTQMTSYEPAPMEGTLGHNQHEKVKQLISTIEKARHRVWPTIKVIIFRVTWKASHLASSPAPP